MKRCARAYTHTLRKQISEDNEPTSQCKICWMSFDVLRCAHCANQGSERQLFDHLPGVPVEYRKNKTRTTVTSLRRRHMFLYLIVCFLSASRVLKFHRNRTMIYALSLIFYFLSLFLCIFLFFSERIGMHRRRPEETKQTQKCITLCTEKTLEGVLEENIYKFMDGLFKFVCRPCRLVRRWRRHAS